MSDAADSADSFDAAVAGRYAMPERLLNHWIEANLEYLDEEANLFGQADKLTAEERAERKEQQVRITTAMADEARPYMPLLLDETTDAGSEELRKIADALSPGGAHTGGLLTLLAMRSILLPNSRLLSAMLYHNWHGGKVGFQFLPDPAETDIDEYRDLVFDLQSILNDGVDGDPLSILVGEDRDFYCSLPDRFTVYRGCAGVTAEQAGEGLCWSTSRRVAEWFAWRGGAGRGLVVSAPVRKDEVLFAKASEFEVVVAPHTSRQLSYRHRPKMQRPTMEWQAST